MLGLLIGAGTGVSFEGVAYVSFGFLISLSLAEVILGKKEGSKKGRPMPALHGTCR